MATVKMQDQTVHLKGEIVQLGNKVELGYLTNVDLVDEKVRCKPSQFLLLNCFPSVDTGVCAKSARHFNEKAAALSNTDIVCISRDLPFAQKRFCAAESIGKVLMYSAFRHQETLEKLGLLIEDGPLAGLSARAVIILNELHELIYVQLVPELTSEPDYEAALEVIQG